MQESQLQHLLSDLLFLKNHEAFKKLFAIAPLEADKYDTLVITMAGAQISKTVVEFETYPMQAVPKIWAQNTYFEPEVQMARGLLQDEQEIDLGDVVNALWTASRPRELLKEEITAVIFPNDLQAQILTDCDQHNATNFIPNEYAFLLSGKLQDGTVTVLNYYAGDMEISTPVYCELTETFIEQTIYEQIPDEHNVVVWGHVHPIESPSGTDIDSFNSIAQREEDSIETNTKFYRSIALLVSSFTKTPSFYDVHSLQQIPHEIT